MRKMRAKLHFTRDGDMEKEFWAKLGGSAADVQPAMDDKEEAKEEAENPDCKYRFWHIREEEGKIAVDEVTERPLRKEMLITNDTFILELHKKVFVWQGTHASSVEKHACMRIATKYKKEWKKPQGTAITRIAEGCEDSHFMSFFQGFWYQK